MQIIFAGSASNEATDNGIQKIVAGAAVKIDGKFLLLERANKDFFKLNISEGTKTILLKVK